MERKQRLIDADDAEKFAREHILDAKERFLILDFLRECSTVDAVEVLDKQNSDSPSRQELLSSFC